MKLLIDMNMSPKWVGVLRDAGFEAVHWSSIGKAKSPDADIIKFARRESYVILTEDLDFGTMLARSNDLRPSVVQLRLQDARPAVLGPHVIAVLLQMSTELRVGALVTVGLRGSRLRMLPIRPIQ